MEFTQHKQIRAPSVTLLPGIIAGFSWARFSDIQTLPWLCTALFLAAISLFYSHKELAGRWLTAFMLASVFGFASYGSLRFEKSPEGDLLDRPPREARLQLKIDQLFQHGGPFNKVSGLATITQVSEPIPLRPKMRVYFNAPLDVIGRNAPLRRGMQIEATGILTPIEASNTPEDAFATYLQSIGIFYRFERQSKGHLITAPNAVDDFLHSHNQKFKRSLQLAAPKGSEIPNVYIAMLLGQKSELSSVQKERYELSGTMHFFAISGLHIGVIAAFIASTLLLLRFPPRYTPIIGLPLLFVFVQITGATPSAMRAFLMAAFFWGSFLFNRQRSAFQALAGSAIFVLIIAPEQLWSIGFQLSYAVVFSILLYGLPLHKAINNYYQPFKWLPEAEYTNTQKIALWAYKNLSLLCAISISAWLASALLSAGLFGYYSPGAILLNILLVNLAGITIISGILSISAGILFLPSVSAFVNHAAWLALSLMDSLISVSSALPGMVIHCSEFPAWLSYSGLALYSATTYYLHQSKTAPLYVRMALPPAISISILSAGTLLF